MIDGGQWETLFDDFDDTERGYEVKVNLGSTMRVIKMIKTIKTIKTMLRLLLVIPMALL